MVELYKYRAEGEMSHKICFLGGARYSFPLDATSEKKFRALSKIGEINVIGFSQDSKPLSFIQNARFYLLPCLPSPLLRYLLIFTAGAFLVLWCILRHGVRILVAQSPHEGAAAAAAKLIACLLGVRVALVVESHGDFEISLFMERQVLFPGFYRTIMGLTARFTLRHADALRTISDSTREQLEIWAPGKPLRQFIAWTDIDVFLSAGSSDSRKGKKPILIYVGVLIPRKGVNTLLDAFSQVTPEFQDARLWIVGKALNTEYAIGLTKQVLTLELDGKVVFREPVPQAQLAKYMSQADVLVLPSLSEGLGRVVLEAMAAGTPVIGSNVGGIPEIIEDGRTGFLVPPGDVSSLADRLRWVLQHRKEAANMGAMAREFAEKVFSSESYVRNYDSLFKLVESDA
jgi:glycosyltransferase involved in cell wall biosynthesis